MANLLDYIAWRGDIPFEQSPFNPVDNIIFSQFSYLDLDGIVPGPPERRSITIAAAAQAFTERQRVDPSFSPENMTIKDAAVFIRALGSAKRYQNCQVFGYVNEIDHSQEKQFSAFCVTISNKWFHPLSAVVYRGTDATLVGWKEDFNMSYSDAVPAQIEAVSYLEKMAKRIYGPLLLAGHSKGGNLAVYAASHCRTKIRRRISVIYSNDAPGFHGKVIQSKGYRELQGRIQSFVPQSSFVGMLFDHGTANTVIKSTESGLMQHDMYSWEVTHNELVRAGGLSNESRLVDKIIRDWINCIDKEQRQRFIEAMYMILTCTQAKSIPELTADRFKTISLIIHSLKNIDDQTRSLIIKTFAALFRSIRNNFRQRSAENQKSKLKPKPPAGPLLGNVPNSG
ncbi:MAG: DUF2974 domain-containing protein [Treponema sp.]|nr:DUF2974 domain-containing protein [Treponema sp.]